VLLQQLTLAGTCLHFHTIESRLARWLLMTQDRAHQDELYLTHSFLAQMLGVRRSGVTIAAQSLQSQRLIDYVRGTINIIDRQGLERASCHCYHSMIGIYNQILK
jgi:CRP-like cAMP-binding protein